VQNASTSYLIYHHKLHPTMRIFLGAVPLPGAPDRASIIPIYQQSCFN